MAWNQGQIWIGRMGQLRRLTGLPGWARSVLLIFALPGIVAMALSALAFLVSLLALLVLTVPVYRLLAALTQLNRADSGPLTGLEFPASGAKRVDATVRDADVDIKRIE